MEGLRLSNQQRARSVRLFKEETPADHCGSFGGMLVLLLAGAGVLRGTERA